MQFYINCSISWPMATYIIHHQSVFHSSVIIVSRTALSSHGHCDPNES